MSWSFIIPKIEIIALSLTYPYVVDTLVKFRLNLFHSLFLFLSYLLSVCEERFAFLFIFLILLIELIANEIAEILHRIDK